MMGNLIDPKGLIAEAYKIENISEAECRSIFLDWALSLSADVRTGKAIESLVKMHEGQGAHPMTSILTQGLVSCATPKRRGGWRSRTRN